MRTMNTTKTNDVAELTKLSLSTFLNIAQMNQYMYLYTKGKELQKDCPNQVNSDELALNRGKMFYHTCLAGLGIIGLFSFGIAGLSGRR